MKVSMKDSLIMEQRLQYSLDYVLDEKIGFGKSQVKLLKPLNLLMTVAGAQSIVLGLLIPKLGVYWNFGDFQKSLLITMAYAGVALGSYVQTYSDSVGRYKFLLITSFFLALFGILSVFSTTFYGFLIIRTFYGVSVGIFFPLLNTYVTQVIPKQKRGSSIALINIYFSVGCLFVCILGWFLLQTDHWRILLFFICIPSVLAFYEIVQHGRQSIRYLWMQKNYERVIDELNYFADGNGKPRIQESQIRMMMDGDKIHQEVKKQCEMRDLVRGKNLKSTLILTVAWISTCFIYYAAMLMFPSILDREGRFSVNFQYFFLIIISGIEILAYYSAQFIMNDPKFGRKKTISLCNFIILLLSLLLIFFNQSSLFLIFVFIGIKFLSPLALVVLFPYSAEMYDTRVRSTALGVLSIFGSLSTTSLGMIGISSLSWANGMGLYYIFILLSSLTSYLIYKMPYCTLGRSLDS